MADDIDLQRVAFLVTCHDRAPLTDRFLRSIAPLLARSADDQSGWIVQLFATDDGSSDNTRQLLVEAGAVVEAGSGSDYWAGGMRRAWRRAQQWRPHLVVLLNDDVEFDSKSLELLIARSLLEPRALIGSSVCDATGNVEYGGNRQASKLRRLSFSRVAQPAEPINVDVLNGNVLALHASVFEELGALGGYTHGFADYELCLRGRSLGYAIVLDDRSAGVTLSPNRPTLATPPLRWRTHWRRQRSVVGGSFSPDWLAFARRNGGWTFVLYVAVSFAKVLYAYVTARARGYVSL